MIRIDDRTTYEELREYAREQSRSLGQYSAVIEIVRYMSDRARTTVATSTTPIVSRQRGGEFVGLVCQFYKGEPYGDGRPARTAKTAPAPTPIDDDQIPF